MSDYPGDFLLHTPVNVPEDEGTFLLPVCINQTQLVLLLDYYERGMWSIYNPMNPALDFSGLMPVLEAMAFVNQPEMTSCGAEMPDEDGCREFKPEVAFITYLPNDPFQTPNYTPPGYLLPPWYTNPGIPLPGVIPTDAMVNFTSLPLFGNLPDLIASGLPRAQIHFEGEGELEIEFVQIPQGGYVLVVVDGNPLNNRLYDLNAVPLTDLEAIEAIFDIVIGQALNASITCELKFATPGEHVVDITFLPQVSDDVIFGMGGGIRRVSLCGLSEVEDVEPVQIETFNDGCGLRWRPNSQHDWIVLNDNICGEDGQDGTDGQDGADGQDGEDGTDGTNGTNGTNGQDGASAELRVTGNTLEWRQSDNSPTWAALYDLSSLEGEDGTDGTDGQNGLGFGQSFYGFDYRCRAAVALWGVIRESLVYGLSRYYADRAASITRDQGYYQSYFTMYPRNTLNTTFFGALAAASLPQVLAVRDWLLADPNLACQIFEVMNFNARVNSDTERTAIVNSIMLATPGGWTANQSSIVRERILAMTLNEMSMWMQIGIGSTADTSLCLDCVPDQSVTWNKAWSYRNGTFADNSNIVTGQWFSGDGWRELSSGGGAVIEIPYWINKLCLTGDSLGATSVRLEIWDIARNTMMASRSFTEPGGGTVSDVTLEFDWEAFLGAGGAAENGVRVKVFGTAGFAGYRGAIAGVSVKGRGDAPPSGSIGYGCI